MWIWRTIIEEAALTVRRLTPAPPRRAPARQPTHPGAILREEVLPALGLSTAAAARALGVTRQALHNVLTERAAVSASMALRLGRLCGNGPELWLRMQQARDLWQAAHDEAAAIAAVPTLSIPRAARAA
jgi:addiction module HigA family antidote